MKHNEFIRYELQPERMETCIVCKMTGCRIDDGWYRDVFLEYDDEGDYLSGSGRIYDAQDTIMGWFCSKQCWSQAMYESADPFEQNALRSVHDACLMISEYGICVAHLNGMDSPMQALLHSTLDFLDAVGDDPGDMPAWCNRETREQTLQRAVQNAQSEIGLLRDKIGIGTKCEIEAGVRPGWEWQIANRARHAASLARIAQELKDSL